MTRRGRRSGSLTDKQEKNEQSQFSHGGFQSAPENLQPLGMSGQFEYPEDPHEPDDSEYGQWHGLVGAFVLWVLRRLGQVHRGVLLLGDDRGQRDEVRYDGDNVNRVHHVLEEVQLVGTGEKPDGEFEREPYDTYGLYQEERVRDVGYLVLLDLRAVCGRVKHFIVFELWQCFQAEYHDGQQYDEYRYDGYYPGRLWAFRVLEQQPYLSLELGLWQWFLFFFYKTLFFPRKKTSKTIQLGVYILPNSTIENVVG